MKTRTAKPRAPKETPNKQRGAKVISMKSRKALRIASEHGPRHVGDMAAAQRVFNLEAEGIAALARTLDADFSRALDLLMACQGRVVVADSRIPGLDVHRLMAEARADVSKMIV